MAEKAIEVEAAVEKGGGVQVAMAIVVVMAAEDVE